ncbi:hypothetical protein BDQ94DRAFT_164700 [Aspergillus welwitschiae]|uniref:Uncharacterized protein n=1 Tax=Aspergillus welwitschiae TaxID=1341132 RepID=A0A3F3PH26_9EURO|nr:hypothetical protein BDQ94DRAFT_164700 [Aspergillus welwitschiae]RDH26178.1 hypothetical protein BDQ94DRAFT_164700 [Aspergillus welwitschiae]
MNELGIIYGEHDILPRLFLAPFHRGQQLVKVYRIILSDSVVLLVIVMTIWALSTAMIWELVTHQRNSESWNGQLKVRSSTSNPRCCEPTELVMRHSPHHVHRPHRPN